MMRVESNTRRMTWSLDRAGDDNGIDEQTMAEMEQALDLLERGDSDVGCLCIEGDEAVFSTDLLERCFSDRESFAAVVRRTADIFDWLEALRSSPSPVSRETVGWVVWSWLWPAI